MGTSNICLRGDHKRLLEVPVCLKLALSQTTNILATPLAAKCSVPFSPAVLDADGNMIEAASAQCCTSDITLDEFKSLKGKMDAASSRATNLNDDMNAVGILGMFSDWPATVSYYANCMKLD